MVCVGPVSLDLGCVVDQAGTGDQAGCGLEDVGGLFGKWWGFLCV